MDTDGEASPLNLVPADILQQILIKLSFSELLSLRAVCKNWHALICSLYVATPHYIPKCVPVHFLNEKLTVYNSKTKAWEEHSLAFFRDQIRTSRLELVATTGGLMCFETDKSNELIVCNPISKLWRSIRIPWTGGDHYPDPPCTGFFSSSAFNFQLQRNLKSGKRTTIVGLILDPVTGIHYKIVVASLQDKYESSTLVYDSLTNSWKNGAEAPDGEEFGDGDATLCNGSLYCLVKTEMCDGKLLKYDVNRDKWSKLSLDMSVMRCKLIEHCGRVLLVKRNSYYSHESAFRFFKLCDNALYKSKSDSSWAAVGMDNEDLSMKRLEETDLIESLKLDCVSINEVMGHLNSTGRGCVLGQKNHLYVLKPPYEDGVGKERTLVTIVDLSTGSCDVLHEMIVESTTYGSSSDRFPEKQHIRNVFHLFSASITVQA